MAEYNEDDYDTTDTLDIDFDVDDGFLEQQELSDFAQDGYFENMEPLEDGFWGYND